MFLICKCLEDNAKIIKFSFFLLKDVLKIIKIYLNSNRLLLSTRQGSFLHYFQILHFHSLRKNSYDNV